MPELPEVETMRRGIVAVVGRRITDVVRPPCDCRPIQIWPTFARLRRRVEGQVIQAAERVGKRVVLVLESGDRLVFEPRMTGLVLLAEPPDRAYLRLALRLQSVAQELLFWDRRGLGQVLLLTPKQFESRLGGAKLGPDALQVSWWEMQDRMRASRRAIKVALLDQRAIAGIGNLYASEILHVAGIHPARMCCQLSTSEWQQLHTASIDVLNTAVKHEGSTLSDGTYRNALNQAGSYQNLHLVYDREGETCRNCGREPVVRIVQAQRSTFFCPHCQPRRPPRRGANGLPRGGGG